MFAFDLFSRSLAWAYLYPSNKTSQETGTAFNLATFNTSWRESAPVVADGKVVRTRPLCAYPTVATYKGTGNTDDAANFTCR